MRRTISIDLDGVLNEYNGKFNELEIPSPSVGCKEFLSELNKRYNIIIFTVRNINLVQNWLKENQLEKYISEVTNIKKPCYIYIDDRAICYKGNFKQTINEINNFEVFWKKIH